MNETVEDSFNGANTSAKDAKRQHQQFTIKQRMDMYAFCVLELETNGGKVSIKKQQLAIQKALSDQVKDQNSIDQNGTIQLTASLNPPTIQIQQMNNNANGDNVNFNKRQQQPQQQQQQQQNGQCSIDINNQVPGGNLTMRGTDQMSSAGASAIEGKTLLELQQEVELTRKSYSDYQKTQVLTSSMLREVQRRFAKYYPNSAIPSRTTIKHVFEKCVAHGTVENIKTPRKAVKIPQGDEIEHLLIHEPQLSLRQMAQKLNVSTGTVSRRCKALGLVPESVTIKHQQMATAKRHKQMKQEMKKDLHKQVKEAKKQRAKKKGS